MTEPRLCDVKVCGMSSWCDTCGLHWDMNDLPEPPCPDELPKASSAALAFLRGFRAGHAEGIAQAVVWLREYADKLHASEKPDAFDLVGGSAIRVAAEGVEAKGKRGVQAAAGQRAQDDQARRADVSAAGRRGL